MTFRIMLAKSIAFGLLLLSCTNAGSPLKTFNPQRRQLEVINQSGENVEVLWVHPLSGESVPLGAPTNGESMNFDSFVNHTFVIKTNTPEVQTSDDSNLTCSSSDPDCQYMAVYQVTEDPRQVVVIREGLSVESVGPTAEEVAVEDIVQLCKKKAERQMRRGSITSVVEAMGNCMEEKTAEMLVTKNAELADESERRREMSRLAENYTCADPQRSTSPPIEVRTWTHQGIDREVHVLHDRGSSRIHMIKDFISPEECAAIKDAAAPMLHRGTVADGKGGSKLSESRKAWQAGVNQQWNIPENLINHVARRLFDYTNEVTGYNMTHEGQEELMSIQYFGNGTEDKTPDRYTPHCDGACDGLPHKMGGRVATMVMYCDAPELGGGTNFQNANVFVKPTVGAAAFFSYLDTETMKTETGFTTHSGCPVYKGTKRIAVQWMRVGVDAENPWDSFDTNTISKKTYEEEDC